MLIPALFVADGVAAHAPPGQRLFDIVVVTDPAAATEVETRWMAEHGIRHHIEDYSELKSVITLSGRLTTATLVKLILARIFAGHYDRILYLDTDLTIHGDVSPLFGLDMEGHAIAAEQRAVMMTPAEEESMGGHFAELGMTRPYRFFNSGVMLIDVEAWNRADLTSRTLDYVRLNPAICLLPDEDALNAVLDGRFAVISPVWNMPPRRWPMMPHHDLVQPVIVHYSGNDKPWRRFGRDKRLFPDGEAFAMYEAFIAKSPWQGWLRSQWTLRDLRRSIKFEIKEAWRALRRKPTVPPREQNARQLERFTQHCAQSRLADVEQGLVIRENGRLRPAVSRPTLGPREGDAPLRDLASAQEGRHGHG